MSNYSIADNCVVESLVSIFMVDKGTMRVLLIRNNNEPYKGYWVLPSKILKNNENLENCITDCIYEQTGIQALNINQSHTFSNVDRIPEKRTIAVSYIGLIDPITLLVKQEKKENIELEWFDIHRLPKLGFDHEEILKKSIDILKLQITKVSTLKTLFPSDFTLPEIKKIYEDMLNIDIDRRNFRKKLLNLDIIESTNELTDNQTGRPAKLYRFKQDIKDIVLF